VGVHGAAVGLYEPSEGILVAPASRFEQLALVHPVPRID
jgi:hypothetical protein